MAGLDLLRVALHNVDILDRHLQRVGGDLREHGRVSVTLAIEPEYSVARPLASIAMRALSQPPQLKPMVASRREGAMPHISM